MSDRETKTRHHQNIICIHCIVLADFFSLYELKTMHNKSLTKWEALYRAESTPPESTPPRIAPIPVTGGVPGGNEEAALQGSIPQNAITEILDNTGIYVQQMETIRNDEARRGEYFAPIEMDSTPLVHLTPLDVMYHEVLGCLYTVCTPFTPVPHANKTFAESASYCVEQLKRCIRILFSMTDCDFLVGQMPTHQNTLDIIIRRTDYARFDYLNFTIIPKIPIIIILFGLTIKIQPFLEQQSQVAMITNNMREMRNLQSYISTLFHNLRFLQPRKLEDVFTDLTLSDEQRQRILERLTAQ